VSKPWNPQKTKVDLSPAPRPSRIRRDPVRVEPAERLSSNGWWESREWEIRLAVIGIILFALGINAVVFDLGEVLSH